MKNKERKKENGEQCEFRFKAILIGSKSCSVGSIPSSEKIKNKEIEKEKPYFKISMSLPVNLVMDSFHIYLLYFFTFLIPFSYSFEQKKRIKKEREQRSDLTTNSAKYQRLFL